MEMAVDPPTKTRAPDPLTALGITEVRRRCTSWPVALSWGLLAGKTFTMAVSPAGLVMAGETKATPLLGGGLGGAPRRERVPLGSAVCLRSATISSGPLKPGPKPL